MSQVPQQESDLAAWAAGDGAWRSVRKNRRAWTAGILQGVAALLIGFEIVLVAGVYLRVHREVFVLLALTYPFLAALSLGALRTWTAFDIDDGKFSLANSASFTFIVATFGLAGMLMPGRLEAPWPLLAMGAPIGAIAFLTAFWAAGAKSKASDLRWLLGFGAVGLVFGWIWAGWLDVNLDRAAGAQVETQVIDKHVSHGRRVRTRALILAPADGNGPNRTLVVGWSVYDRTRLGDTVCLLVHPGALQTPWHELTSCSPPAEAPAA